MDRLEFMGVLVTPPAGKIIVADGISNGEKVGFGWGQLDVGREERPDVLHLSVTAQPPTDGVVLAVNHGKAERLGEGASYHLNVKVEWRKSNPFTRIQYNDNVDIIRLWPDGRFVDVQVGLVTRSGSFFLTAQRVYVGQLVRTRSHRGGPVEWGVVPSHPVHAYPGREYKEIWSAMAGELVREAQVEKASVQRSYTKAVEWKPPAPSSKAGYEFGVTEYFNLITGTGMVWRPKDGERFFFHFSTIHEEERKPAKPFPALPPMAGVYFKLEDPPSDPSKAPRIKEIMPA